MLCTQHNTHSGVYPASTRSYTEDGDDDVQNVARELRKRTVVIAFA